MSLGIVSQSGRPKFGKKTFGKGSVQKILPLTGQEGSALRLTTAKYYTPSHKVIHGKGIQPDYKISMSRTDEELLFLSRTPGGMEMIDEDRREEVKNFKDPQLVKAMEILVGKKKLRAQADKKKKEENNNEDKTAKPEAKKEADSPEKDSVEKTLEKQE